MLTMSWGCVCARYCCRFCFGLLHGDGRQYPLQLVRSRLQAQGLEGMPQYNGIVDVVKRTVAQDGVFGLYRGLAPNMMKALPAISISYAVYETVKKNFR